jgi:hypothetical protein
MSTFWTPSGERPIPRSEPEPGPDAPEDRAAATPADDDAQVAAMAEMQRQLVEAPAAFVVANHCIALVELAALHLDQSPPRLDDAQVAIDAIAAVVDALGPRLGQYERPLRETVRQIRLAFVEAKTGGT